LRAGAALAAAATLVLSASGRALLARRFRSGGLDRGIEGARWRSRLAALAALTTLTATASAATSTSITAALTLTLTLAGRCLSVGGRGR